MNRVVFGIGLAVGVLGAPDVAGATGNLNASPRSAISRFVQAADDPARPALPGVPALPAVPAVASVVSAVQSTAGSALNSLTGTVPLDIAQSVADVARGACTTTSSLAALRLPALALPDAAQTVNRQLDGLLPGTRNGLSPAACSSGS